MSTNTVVLGRLEFICDGNEMFINRLATDDPEGDGEHVATAEGIWEEVWDSFVKATAKEDAACRTDGVGEATRLLGFALFNHAKHNAGATETLMRKAYKALAGREWDE